MAGQARRGRLRAIRHVVLLRGINVGGHNKLPMADLRGALERAGFDDVSTYIQSGNVAVTAPSCDAAQISDVIEQEFGLEIPVIVRTAADLAAVVDSNPFPEMEPEPKKLMTFFLAEPINPNVLDDFDHGKHHPDRIAATPSEVYVAYDDAAGSSKLTIAVVERAVGTRATARNWTTVLKLVEMAG